MGAFILMRSRLFYTPTMPLLSNLLISLVALSHIGFLILEMFLWNHPIGQEAFSMPPEASASSAVLAMNQGLYNGFLAAGLIWGLLSGKRDVKIFFLGCVLAAGIFGAFTAKIDILFVQALPSAFALACVFVSSKRNEA